MKYIFGFLTIAVLMVGCQGGDAGGPKTTVAAFIETMKKGDIDGLKKLITKSDASLLETVQSLAKQFGKDSGMVEKMKQQFIEKSRNVSFTVKDEKIDGDKAEVNVEIKDKDSTETHPFKLLKEDGSWKISLLSTGLSMGGSHGGMSNENANFTDSSLKKDLEQMKNLNIDSLQSKIKDATDKIKNDPEAAKKMEEMMKKLGQH